MQRMRSERYEIKLGREMMHYPFKPSYTCPIEDLGTILHPESAPVSQKVTWDDLKNCEERDLLVDLKVAADGFYSFKEVIVIGVSGSTNSLILQSNEFVREDGKTPIINSTEYFAVDLIKEAIHWIFADKGKPKTLEDIDD